MCRKDALCKAPRFEKGKAQEDGIAQQAKIHWLEILAASTAV